MILRSLRTPLVATECEDPQPGPGEIRVKVADCGVCRTDLHVVDGDLPHPTLPIIPGHEIVGRIDRIGSGVEGLGVEGLALGLRVGVPWLGHTCGVCPYCRSQRENLCDRPLFTGFSRNGGLATSVVADARFAFPLGDTGPGEWSDDAAIAPLLCAGLIGWRALGIAGDAPTLGLYGFGAAAHILAQVARWQGRVVHAFTRPRPCHPGVRAQPGRRMGRRLRRDAARAARRRDHLRDGRRPGSHRAAAVRKGGRVVCAGIHMSDTPNFPYRLLWEERQILSVANLTRQDGLDFLRQVPGMGIVTRVTRYPLDCANEALADLRAGRFEGAAVLIP